MGIASLITLSTVLLGGVLLLSHVAGAEAEQSSQSTQKILTIYDNGKERGVFTEAKTLREALKRAEIILDEHDATEPSLDYELVASKYIVNIYRARPVLVVDGDFKARIMTAHRSAKQIAKEVGLTLRDEDRAVMQRSEGIVEDGASEKMVITRAVPFIFDFYGKKKKEYTAAATVGELLDDNKIVLEDSHRVRPSVSTPIKKGMTVKLWREGKQTITTDEVIKFKTKEIRDADKPRGYEQVKTKGENGERTVTYDIEVKNGKEIYRKEIESIVSKKPVDKVVVIGVKGVYTTPSENQKITWDYLRKQGFSREQTAGIMGNLMQEHRFNTDGDGLAQWIGGRKARLTAMEDPFSIHTQLDYLMIELNGPYRYVKKAILATNSVEQSTIIFQDQFERCGICKQQTRINYAYNILETH